MSIADFEGFDIPIWLLRDTIDELNLFAVSPLK
jgi:hypothetical protein